MKWLSHSKPNKRNPKKLEWVGFYESRYDDTDSCLQKGYPRAKGKHNCMFCLNINASNQDELKSANTTWREKNVFGSKSKGISERRREREDCPFIKLSLTFTPSTFICVLMKPLKAMWQPKLKENKNVSCQKIPLCIRKIIFSMCHQESITLRG